MLAQTTFFLALLTTLALGVLSTNLIASGVAHEHQVAKYDHLAMEDAVDDFTSLMQSYVKEHGSEGPWPAAIPESAAIPLCPAEPAASDVTTCPYTYRVTAKITGSSGSGVGAAAIGAIATNDRATNLQKFLINEERISATVGIRMSDASGVIGSETRYLTMRVFEASPYVMISGQRDIGAMNGQRSAIEGDNGGVVPSSENAGLEDLTKAASSPDPVVPSRYHSTEIVSQTQCKNVDSIANADSDRPSHNQGRGVRSLAWGIGGVGYEIACSNRFASPSPGTFEDEGWRNGNDRL